MATDTRYNLYVNVCNQHLHFSKQLQLHLDVKPLLSQGHWLAYSVPSVSVKAALEHRSVSAKFKGLK